MIRKTLTIVKEGVSKRYTCVTCVCIFKDYHYGGQHINEPVLYFQQRRKTKYGKSCKETVFPLSKISYMMY